MDEKLIAHIKQLKDQTGARLIDCKQTILTYPFPDVSVEERAFHVAYLRWLRTFYDRDRSIEAYKKALGMEE